MVLFAGAKGLLAQDGTAEPPTSGQNANSSANGAQNENGAERAGARDASLESPGPLPPSDFLPSCLKLIRQRQTARARQLLEPVVADHPGWAKARFYLGLSYHIEKRYERAAELFKRALEVDPLYHTPRVYYGWCLYYLGDPEAAREMFESYLEVKPDYPDVLFALGLIAFDADEIERARRHFERVIALAQERNDAKTEAKARARLADVLIRLDMMKPARVQLERSIEMNRDNFEVYYKLSRVLERLGEPEAAQAARLKHDEVRDRIMKKDGRDNGEAHE
jgi:tetratricopeptide (TPR) repeat protein